EVGACTRGDVELRTVDDVLVAVTTRGRADVRDVGAAAGLGDRERTDRATLERGTREPLDQVGVARRDDVRGGDAVAEQRRDQARRTTGEDDLLEDREHVEGGAARAAVLLCDRGAEQARVGGLAMQFARDLAGALPLVQVGDDLLAREVGGELTERLLLVGVPADHFGGGHAYSPFQTGSRFCMKAMTPSRVSALVVRRARALSVSSQGRSSAGT